MSNFGPLLHVTFSNEQMYQDYPEKKKQILNWVAHSREVKDAREKHGVTDAIILDHHFTVFVGRYAGQWHIPVRLQPFNGHEEGIDIIILMN